MIGDREALKGLSFKGIKTYFADLTLPKSQELVKHQREFPNKLSSNQNLLIEQKIKYSSLRV